MKNVLCLDHVALCVSDVSRSVEWYVSNAGAKVEYEDDTWAMVNVGGSKIAFVTEGHHPQHIAFRVSSTGDLGSNYKKHRDGSTYVYSKDPDGNTVEFICWEEEEDDDWSCTQNGEQK